MMAGKKISAQALVSVVTDVIKMPTGESGDKTISVGQVKSHVRASDIQSLEIATASLADDATEVGSIAVSAIYTLLVITTSAALRVRLYTTAAARDADLARPSTQEQSEGSSLVLEFVSDATLLSAVLTPAVTNHAANGLLYYSVTNISGSTQALSCSIDYAVLGV